MCSKGFHFGSMCHLLGLWNRLQSSLLDSFQTKCKIRHGLNFLYRFITQNLNQMIYIIHIRIQDVIESFLFSLLLLCRCSGSSSCCSSLPFFLPTASSCCCCCCPSLLCLLLVSSSLVRGSCCSFFRHPKLFEVSVRFRKISLTDAILAHSAASGHP